MSRVLVTGSIVTAGGIAAAKAIYAGGKIVTTDATDATSPTTGSLITAGGMGVGKRLTSTQLEVKNALAFNAASFANLCQCKSFNSCSSWSIWEVWPWALAEEAAGGPSEKPSNSCTQSVSMIRLCFGSIVTAGGIAAAKAIYAGGKIVTTDATDATSPTTGSLITAGGMGVGKRLTSTQLEVKNALCDTSNCKTKFKSNWNTY